MQKKLWLLVLTTLLVGPLAVDLDQRVLADDPPIWDGYGGDPFCETADGTVTNCAKLGIRAVK